MPRANRLFVQHGIWHITRSWAGYNEIQKPRKRYVVIDHERLAALAATPSLAKFQHDHRL